MVERRREINPSDIRIITKRIFERLSMLDEYVSAKKIHSYISTKSGEVDTRYFIDYMSSSGKIIVIPKLNKHSKTFQHASFAGWDGIVRSSDGYFEPTKGFDDDLNGIDLIIVPAMAVSILGQRVGYGGGFYDRLLKNIRAVKVVPAFEFQVFDNIETDPHDIRVDKIITERRIINTRKQS